MTGRIEEFLGLLGKFKKFKHRIISEYANDLIIVINQNLEVEYTNEMNFLTILGYDFKEIQSTFTKQIIWHEEDFEKAIKLFDKIFEKGEGISQLRLKHKNGKFIWFEIKGNRFIENNIKKLLLISRDISERKKAEEKLKESEEKYRNIIENSKEGYFEVDLKGNFTFFNDALCKQLKYSPEELMGMNFKSYMTEENSKRTFNVFNEVYRTEIEKKDFQYELVTKDGTRIYGESSISLRYDGDGRKIGFSGFLRDITERKKAEEKLKESEEKFRHLFEKSPFAILLVDLEGTIYDCNVATEKIFGYKKEDIISENFLNSKFFPKESQPVLKKIIDTFSRNESVESMEIQVYKKDGSLTWIQLEVSIVKIGAQSFIQAIAQDTTEKKNREILIFEQNKKLSEINVLKTELMRTTSHELKTPLISIKGFTDLLLDVHYDKFDDDTISIFNEIKQGCVRLEKLIMYILEAAKLESGQIKLKYTEEDFSFLIKYCVEELKMLYKMRDQTISLKIHEKLITKFEKERIYEVISNLLSNAIKYSPPKSEIIVKSEIKDGFIIISVKDSGIGFTDDEKNKIFKQFGKIKRYDQDIDIEIGGTGLGLYIAKKIVELHGGSIWMESEGRNKGSTFYFSLPLVKD